MTGFEQWLRKKGVTDIRGFLTCSTTSFMLADIEQYAAERSAASLSRWIPVEERLPDDDIEVLCWDAHQDDFAIGCLHTDDYGAPVWEDMDGRVLNNVTHWQDLPSEPVEVKS